MFLFTVSVILGTACGIVLFLIIISGDVKNFRERFTTAFNRKCMDLPIVPGEDIDMTLDVLQFKLDKKQIEIESSKSKVLVAVDSLQKLTNTSNDVKRYYKKLKDDIYKSEQDCRDIQYQIEQYKKKREMLILEIKEEEGEHILERVKTNLSNISSKATFFSNEMSAKSSRITLAEEEILPQNS